MARFSFIGMSGVGKSYWTRKLAAAGFLAIGIDDRIEQKLSAELAAGGHRGVGGLAAWMGWPDQPLYRERAQKYLDSEIECTGRALDEIEQSNREDIVLDTTGSVVYTGDELAKRLKKATIVVYLAAPPEEEKVVIARYLSDPKPVLWGDQFQPLPNESAQQTVARCYPRLIAQRKQLYEKLADRVISMAKLRSATADELTARGFIEFLNTQARIAG